MEREGLDELIGNYVGKEATLCAFELIRKHTANSHRASMSMDQNMSTIWKLFFNNFANGWVIKCNVKKSNKNVSYCDILIHSVHKHWRPVPRSVTQLAHTHTHTGALWGELAAPPGAAEEPKGDTPESLPSQCQRAEREKGQSTPVTEAQTLYPTHDTHTHVSGSAVMYY